MARDDSARSADEDVGRDRGRIAPREDVRDIARGVGDEGLDWSSGYRPPLGAMIAKPRGVVGEARPGESRLIAALLAAVGVRGTAGADTLRFFVNSRAKEERPFLRVSVSSMAKRAGVARRASLSFLGTSAGVERLPLSSDWPRFRCDRDAGGGGGNGGGGGGTS